MTRPDFSAAFRSVATSDLPPPPSAHGTALSLIRRDHRRTRVLAAIALLLWLAGAAGMLVLLYGLNRFILFIRIVPDMPWSLQHLPPGSPAPTTRVSEVSTDMMLWGTTFLHHSMPYAAASVVALAIAAILTVLLIFSSRRSTLNRINLSLAQLSEQLKQLSPTSQELVLPPGPTPPDQTKGTTMRSLLILAITLTTLLTGLAVAATTTRPWQGYPRVSPFHAVRYPTPTTIEVQVADTWYDLKSLNALPTPDLIKAAKSLDKKDWQKRLEEDLVEVLTRTNHPPKSPDTATLELTDLSTHATTTKEVPMTESNRRALWEAHNPKPATKPS